MMTFTHIDPAKRKPTLLKRIWRAIVTVFDFITGFG
jgi:hypothetical protein